MQDEAARFAGEASGQGEETPPQGFGGRQLLAHADASGPAGQVVCQHLDGQPGGVGWETSRWQVVEAHAVLEIADGILDLGVARTPSSDWVGLQVQGVALAVGDEGVMAVGGEQGQLRTGSGFTLRTMSLAGTT